MLDVLKRIFRKQPDQKFKDLVSQGALIIDVRTKDEYHSGHITGSINIPVSEMKDSLSKLTNQKAVYITCCASGGRSEAAKQLLNAKGYLNVYNGGGWKSLRGKI